MTWYSVICDESAVKSQSTDRKNGTFEACPSLGPDNQQAWLSYRADRYMTNHATNNDGDEKETRKNQSC